VTMSKGTVDEERVRRALFAVVTAYIVSSWMVDFAFRPTFFLFVAATGALHRLVLDRSKQEQETEVEPTGQFPVPLWKQRLLPTPSLAVAGGVGSECALEPSSSPVRKMPSMDEEPEERSTLNWRRLGFIDFGLILGFTAAATWFWRYSIRRF